MGINQILISDVQNYLKGNLAFPFDISDLETDTLQLSAGRTDKINDNFYRIEGGNLAVTDSASNGISYIYIDENGDGTASAELLNTVPVFSVAKGGFYSGNKKAVVKLVKTGAVYTDKVVLTEKTLFMNYLEASVIKASSFTTTSLEVNTTTNKFTGTVTAFDLSPYISAGWTTAYGGSHIFRIGNMGILQINAYRSTVLSGVASTIYAGIPSAWRPSTSAHGPSIGNNTAFQTGYISSNTSGSIVFSVYTVYSGATTTYITGCLRFKF